MSKPFAFVTAALATRHDKDVRADLFRCDLCAHVEVRERAFTRAPIAQCPACNP